MASLTPATPTVPPIYKGSRPDVEHSDRSLPVINLTEGALALRKAWLAYLVLGAIPPLAMIKSFFFLIFFGPRYFTDTTINIETSTGMLWLIFGMVWISVLTPLSFFVRTRMWQAWYDGGVVSPNDYLKGNLVVWIPLVAAGVLGFVGLAHTAEPASLFTSVTAFILFLAMFPNGHAMTRPVGHEDDPAVYEEPR